MIGEVSIWDEVDRQVAIVASDGPPSAGMARLYGYRICIDVVDGGAVVIEARV